MNQDRKNYIGGSDIPAILGISRWKTQLQLWAEKTGEVDVEDISHIEAVELGTELEDFVAKKFERKTGMKVRRAPKLYAHKIFSYMGCQVDRLVEGTDELLECKTCSAWKAKEWEGEEIPMEYIAQVMWQLGITGRKIGHIAVLIGGQSFKYKKIYFDEAMFGAMVAKAVKFMIMVKEKTAPMAVGADNAFIQELLPESDGEIQEANDLNDKVAYRQELKMHVSELMGQLDTIEAEIKQAIGEHKGIKTDQYIVTWTPQQRSYVDTEKLKAEGLYEKYSTIKSSRVMRVTKNKEKDNG